MNASAQPHSDAPQQVQDVSDRFVSQGPATDALRFNAVFADWPVGALELLLGTAKLKGYPKGASIYDAAPQGPEILIIVSGYLRISRYIPGEDPQAVSMVGSGRIVSTCCGFTPSCELPMTCWAHSDVLVIHVQQQQLTDLLDTMPALWRLLGMAVLRQQRELLEALVDQNRGGAQQRLASLLLHYSQWCGVPNASEEHIQRKVLLSQTQLASLLQLSRQTVNEALRAFSDAGWICVGYGCITLLDPAALQQHSGGKFSAEAPQLLTSGLLVPSGACDQP
jgi:CRP-like cAMP-binding protein